MRNGEAIGRVFVSYRRDDAAGHAGRLRDGLIARLGERRVFMDVHMRPGVDFVEHITDAVAGCHCLLVVIGPRWLTATNPEGGRRLEDPEDFVRLEVESALARPGIAVIPVLVGGATMPSARALPASMQALARRHAIQLSDDSGWHDDLRRLIDVVEAHGAVGDESSSGGRHRTRDQQPVIARPLALARDAVVLAAVVALPGGALRQVTQSWPDALVGLVVARSVGWACIVAAVAAMLAWRRDPASWRTAVVRGGLGGAAAGALGAVAHATLELPSQGDRILGLAITGAVAGAVLGDLLGAASRGFAGGMTGGAIAGLLVFKVVNDPGSEVLDALTWALHAAPTCGAAVGLAAAARRPWAGRHTRASRPDDTTSRRRAAVADAPR